MARDHRLFAALYDRLGESAERGWQGRRRARLLAGAHGEVIDIGAGTGANLPHLAGVERVTLVEPDRHMRARLERRLGEARVPAVVSPADAQALPFADASFDTAICTLVLCTVADAEGALAEIRRVLRPGGRLLFMEHVRGEGRVARLQDVVRPVWGRLAAGCHPNRDTVAAIGRAGFTLETLERYDPPMRLGSLLPHVEGVARLGPTAATNAGPRRGTIPP